MTQPKLERYVQNISLVTLVVIEGLCLRNYMLTQNADVNGTIADWASALASFLAVIVACMAAWWAKQASNTTEKISNRSVDLGEFSIANDILKKLCEDTLNCYKETRLEQVSYEFRERSIIDFIKSVENIYSSFEIMDLEQKNIAKCENAIRAYLGENIYNAITKYEYKSILTHHMSDIYNYTVDISMKKIKKKHDTAVDILKRHGWDF